MQQTINDLIIFVFSFIIISSGSEYVNVLKWKAGIFVNSLAREYKQSKLWSLNEDSEVIWRNILMLSEKK